jgi:hypothetical protein
MSAIPTFIRTYFTVRSSTAVEKNLCRFTNGIFSSLDVLIPVTETTVFNGLLE